jgi:protocatechuate 3,4-dioxygenase alpha subunit
MSEAGLTASQTVGPYLSIGLLRDLITTELVDPSDPRAITIRGQLLDGAGEPVPDGLVELWQANAAGRYRHPADDRDVPLEEGFLGFGRSGTVRDGLFEFVTVKPGRVPWPGGGEQAPHVVLGVFARGLLKRTLTRMYFADEQEANAADPVLGSLTSEQRATLIAAPDDGGLRFDIHLQGTRQTTFFAC